MSEQLKRRALVIKRIILIGIIFAVVGIVADIADYFRTQSWYQLADAGFILSALACLGIAWRAARREDLDRAAYWMLLAVFMGIGADELLWVQAPTLNAAVAVLILLVGALVLPRHWTVWVSIALGYVGFTLLVNWLEPLPRRVLAESGGVFVAYLTVIGLSFVMVLWQYISLRGRIRTIRTRLLVTYVPLVLLLAVVIGGTAFLVARNQVRGQVENQLESVAVLKEAEIQTWLNDLLVSLDVAASGPSVVTVLEDPAFFSTATETSIQQQFRERMQWAIQQMGLFEEMFVMDLEGQVVISTNPGQEGKVYAREVYFQEGREGAYVHPPSYSPSLGETSVLAARPLANQAGETVAVLAGRADMEALSEIMLERAGLGETGETYLVGTNYTLLTRSRVGEDGISYVRTTGSTRAVEQQQNGAGQYENYRGVPVVGVYRWLPDFQVALLAEQHSSEAFRGVTTLLLIDAGVAVGAALLIALVSVILTNNITNPLARLAETAQQIAAGDRERTAIATAREDEIGALARSFNSMTQQLRSLIVNLEARVAERTRELEQRSTYLEASAEVSSVLASILDRERLIQETVDLIREQFDFYYVALFLVEGRWAVLRAGTGEAGRKMLVEEHQLEVGGDSMIGQCIEHEEALIALDVGEQAVRFDNPYLPETRSEGALPLRSRGEVLGAISIQSKAPNAFDQDTITLLQTMADQIAIALDNANLFVEVQQSLETERRIYGELSREAWSELLHSRSKWGYDYAYNALSQVDGDEDWTPEMHQAAQTGQSIQNIADDGLATLIVPLRVRERVMGVLSFSKEAPGERWTDEEKMLLETLSEELGLALESARLYEDTQRRAAREQLTSEVTARFRESLDMEAMLRTAASEMRQALGLKDLVVQIDTQDVGDDETVG
jgi:GAF domain-containing protein/HAMP domain-containing protein